MHRRAGKRARLCRCAGGRQGAGGCSAVRAAAHVEHRAHVGDAGRVEADRLVEVPRFLARVASRAYGAGRAVRRRRERPRGVHRTDAQSAHGRARECRLRQGAGIGRTQPREQHTHPEHVAHVGDTGRVPAQWLVELVRGLPRERVASRACGGGASGERGARSVRGEGVRLCRLGSVHT